MWWLIALAVAALCALAWWFLRRPKAPARRRPTSRPPAGGPRAGEIWWADVPYEDGSGSKVRPCLVVRPHRKGFEVLKITSRDQSRRRDHVEIATRHWDPKARRNSFLDLTDPIRVPVTAFGDRAGRLDAPTWRKVRRLHGL